MGDIKFSDLPVGLTLCKVIRFAPATQFSLVAINKYQVIPKGTHPAMRLETAFCKTSVHDTTAPKFTIIDNDGNIACAEVTASATVGVSVGGVVSTATKFEEDEDVFVSVTTAGGATAVIDITMNFVTVEPTY